MMRFFLKNDFATEHFTFKNYINLDSACHKEILKNRNSPEIRKWMTDGQEISFSEHNEFIKSLKNSEDRIYWACFYNDRMIGSFCLNPFTAGFSGEIGSYIFPEYMGQGLGSLMKKEACEYVLKSRLVSNIISKVRKENAKNIHVNKKIGFSITYEDDEYVYMTMRFGAFVTRKTFIIAEMSANHNHNFNTAVKTVKAAKKAGADAIKLQTYTADSLTLDCDGEDFVRKGGLWSGYTLYNLYKEAYTPWEWHKELFRIAKEEGLVCFSTPFDKTAVDFLDDLENPIYKIASFEITDIPLIKYVASKKKPIILSTGVAMTKDIELALRTIRTQGCNDITLLKCTSEYPAPIAEVNLLTIPDMKTRFGVKSGISDHTLGSDVAVAAVALGAEVVEKHFIIDRGVGGPDAAFSMEADEFTAMVKSIRNVESALGFVKYPSDVREIRGRTMCRSLYVASDIKKGDVITEENVRSVRPGYGEHPKYLPELLGKRVNRDLKKGDRFFASYCENEAFSSKFAGGGYRCRVDFSCCPFPARKAA